MPPAAPGGPSGPSAWPLCGGWFVLPPFGPSWGFLWPFVWVCYVGLPVVRAVSCPGRCHPPSPCPRPFQVDAPRKPGLPLLSGRTAAHRRAAPTDGAPGAAGQFRFAVPYMAESFPRLSPALPGMIKSGPLCHIWPNPSPGQNRHPAARSRAPGCRFRQHLPERCARIPRGSAPHGRGGQIVLLFSATRQARRLPGGILCLLLTRTFVPMMEKYVPNLCHFAHSNSCRRLVYSPRMALKSPI